MEAAADRGTQRHGVVDVPDCVELADGRGAESVIAFIAAHHAHADLLDDVALEPHIHAVAALAVAARVCRARAAIAASCWRLGVRVGARCCVDAWCSLDIQRVRRRIGTGPVGLRITRRRRELLTTELGTRRNRQWARHPCVEGVGEFQVGIVFLLDQLAELEAGLRGAPIRWAGRVVHRQVYRIATR